MSAGGRYLEAVVDAVDGPTSTLVRLAGQIDHLLVELGEETIRASTVYARAAKDLVAGFAVLQPVGAAERCHILAAQLEVLVPVFKDLFFAESGKHFRLRPPPAAGAPVPAFDADLPPTHPTNQAAAKARGLRYVADREVYVDADGLPALDQFGQALG